MQLTGVSNRAVSYKLYDAAMADSATVYVTRNGVMTLMVGPGGSSMRIMLNYGALSAEANGPAYPMVIATTDDGTVGVKNASGGAQQMNINGVYWT